MKPVPLQDCVLCDLVDEGSEEAEEKGVFFKKETMRTYKIVSISKSLEGQDFNVGDTVVCNATGTMMCIDGTKKFLFKIENIAGKIEE